MAIKYMKKRKYTKRKVITNSGKNHYNWKGDNVGYFAVHAWIYKWKGTPKKCENCGSTTKKKYEWANIDHKYRRILEDYIRMCTPCHHAYDRDILKVKINQWPPKK